MVLGHEIKILGFIVDYKFTDISLERGLKYVSAKKDQLSKSVGGDVFHMRIIIATGKKSLAKRINKRLKYSKIACGIGCANMVSFNCY